MTKRSRFDALAAEAAARIEQSEDLGRQLTLLPGEAEAEGEARGRGAARRNKGLAKWLQANGYRDPGEQLAELANLNTHLDPVTAAIARAEQAALGLGVTSEAARLVLFQTFFAASIRATEALAPYVHAKAATEAPTAPGVQIYMHQGPAGEGARLVNPSVRPGGGLVFEPPPMPEKSKKIQGVEE